MPVLAEVTANGDHPPSIFGLRAFGSPVSRAAKRTAPTGSGTVPRPSPRARLEALWKQEGAKCCQFLRNPAHAVRRAGGFKWRKCRRKTEPSAVVHGLFGTAHNLKVVGSNPTPATKFLRHIKRLRAALRGGFLRFQHPWKHCGSKRARNAADVCAVVIDAPGPLTGHPETDLTPRRNFRVAAVRARRSI